MTVSRPQHFDPIRRLAYTKWEINLRNCRPRILQFSGHGDNAQLLFENRDGLSEIESGKRLAAEIHAALGPDDLPEIIVLNACESDKFIDDLSRVCTFLVFQRRKVSDRAAIAFSQAFYTEIGTRPLPDALDLAQQAMLEVDPSSAGIVGFEEGDAGISIRASAEAREGDPHRSATPDTIETVWYGTDRKLRDPADSSRGYSENPDTHLHFGKLEVRVAPRNYGTVGGLFRKRVKTLPSSLREFARDDFRTGLNDDLAGWRQKFGDEPELLLYIHGYNVSFDSAARRAAQIHHDLNVPGVTAFYSWASHARLGGYWDDEQNVELCERHLQAYIEELLDNAGVRRFHLLAHSMGNRALLKALQRVTGQAQRRTGKLFGQIFLCAPDVETATFCGLAEPLPQLSERTTLYISKKDRPLNASRWIHGDDRAGIYHPVTTVPGIDTIATEAVSAELLGLGHGYYGDNPAVLGDISRLMASDQDPSKRPRFHETSTPEGRPFYKFVS